MPIESNEPKGLSRRDFIKSAAGAVANFRGLPIAANTDQMQENRLVNKENGKWEFVFASPNPNEAHNSANRFANEIGNLLKSNYPSRVLEPNVELEIFTRNGQKFYQIKWNCKIVNSSVTDADYYFDRRGTLLSGRTLQEAKNKVEAELKISGKVQEMRRNFGNRGKIYETFIRESYSNLTPEEHWYIKEFFMVVPK